MMIYFAIIDLLTNVISSQDVLFGRGGIRDYPGNKHYRALVQAQKSAYLSAKNSTEKRAIAKSIMQQLNNLRPPGRFIIEDRSGLGHIYYSAADDDTKRCSHPLVSNKVWVQVSDDLVIDKIMHGLREKDKKTKTCGNNKNEKKRVARSDSFEGVEDVIANLEPIGENELSFDDLFDDIKENNGQCEGLLVVGNAKDINEVGQFDDLFDVEENIAGQFNDVFDSV